MKPPAPARREIPRFSQEQIRFIHPAVKAITALLALIVHAAAAPSDPGETAIRYLEKIRSREVDLTPGADTALSAQTGDAKREEISRRLERMARDLGSDPLEIGSVKQDGELAAVLVHKTGGFDPGRLQVFPVALIKREKGWSAAPLPASFENSGIGYAAALRKRIESLENWMLSQRAYDLEQLRDQSAQRMRNRIESALPPHVMRAMDAFTTTERFLKACETRKLPEVLGLLGGLSTVLPDDWGLRLKAADTAMADPAKALRPWRLLMAPEVLRVPVFQDEDQENAMASIACLDPLGNPPEFQTPRVELVHLELNKTADGFWRVDPPAGFTQESQAETEDEGENLDIDLLDLFPAKLALKYPAKPATTAAGVRDALFATFRQDAPSSWAPLIPTAGEPDQVRESCAAASRIWWQTRSSTQPRKPIPLAFHEAGDSAVSLCQFFDPRNPDKPDLRSLYFQKTASGWLWSPAADDEITRSHQDWVEDQERKWDEGWQEQLLVEAIETERLQASSAPDEAAARKVVEAWLAAIRTGDISAALALTARLKSADSGQILLRNLGYELGGTQRMIRPATITGSRRGSYWTTVSAKNAFEDKPAFPLYPVISTPAGPRILLEVDLLASGNRSRDYLNKTSLNRLRKTDADAAGELEEAFAEHQKSSIP